VSSNSHNKVITNTIFNALSGVFGQVLSVITGVFIARVLGPEGYGEISFASVVVGYFMLGTDFGITAIAIRGVAQNIEKFRSYLWTYLLCKILLSVFAIGGLIILISIKNFGNEVSWLIFAYGLTIITSIFNVNWIFSAHQRMDLQAICEMSEKIIYTLLVIIILMFVVTKYAVPIAMVFAGVVAAVVGFYLLKRNFRYLKGKFDSVFFRDLFIYSWPVGLSNGASRINTNLDTIFLQMYWGSSFTGEYSAVYRLMGFGIMFGNFFTSALYPLICERAVSTKELLGSTLDLSTRILLIFLVPVSVVLMIVGPELVIVLFGNAYEHGGMALRILSWIPLLLLISRLYGNTLTALNRQNLFMVIMVLSAIVNVCLNYIFIPHHGMGGAALATLLTEGFILLCVIYFISRDFQLKIYRSLLQTLFSGSCMGIVLYFVAPYSILLALAVAQVVYIVALYSCRGFTAEEYINVVQKMNISKLKIVGKFPNS